MAFDHAKLKALVHYIIDAVPGAILDDVQLNQILWYSEKEMYLRNGSTITGESYLKYPNGPVSKHLLPALKELEQEQKIVSRRARIIHGARLEYISLNPPDITMFSAEEIDVISRQIATHQVREKIHDHAWTLAEDWQEIPMYLVLAETRQPTLEDLKWAM